MEVPAHLRQYPCDDYFASEWAGTGYWCAPSQLVVVFRAADIQELPEIGFLAVGRPGADGILFGYRSGEPGVWAYYPIDREFEPVAPSVASLVRRWTDGLVRL